MRIPLLVHSQPTDIFAFHRNKYITVAEFLHDSFLLAETLPDKKYILNDCANRYSFMVGFVAAMLRQQISLFPSSRATGAWRQLKQSYSNTYCLTDQSSAPDVFNKLLYSVITDKKALKDEYPIPEFSSDQEAAIAFTSGSSGQPKPYLKHWGSWVGEAIAGGASLKLTANCGGAIVATVPSQHMYGFIASILLALQWGYAFSIEQPFYPEDIRLVLSNTPGHPFLVTTPAQLRACVLEKTEMPETSFLLSSAAPLPKSIAEQAELLFNTKVMEFYGSTETGAFAVRRPTKMEIWHTFAGVEVAPNESGYWVKADYFREPVLLTDRVEILSLNQFSLLGRDNDLIKISGKRASLLYLNQQLLEIEGVVDGTFFVPKTKEGVTLRLMAFVVAPNLSHDQIMMSLRERIDEAFLPRPLRLVDRLPRTTTGKLPRQGLLQLMKKSQKNDEGSATSFHSSS